MDGSQGERYEHPLAGRYASREMQRIFSPAHRFRTWRSLWIALARAQKELGVAIPDGAVEAMEAARDHLDLDRAAEYERRFRHDVMAHVHLYGDAAPEARGVIHLGATSAYVSDNADLVLHREALELIRHRLVRVMEALASFAREHRALPTLGYTHFQPAQPTTVGKRATLWLQDFLLDLQEVEDRIEGLPFRGAKGTTGTQASFLELLDGDGAKVEELDRKVAEAMGFSHRFAVTGQTYPRKVDFTLAASVAGVATSASRMAHDLRLLAHLQEVEEPFEEEQIGSSAMPYKRNPMRAERITALARHALSLLQDPGHTAATQWLERTLDDSANRRLSLPDLYLTVDGMLVLAENVCRGLRVNPAVVERNLARHLPFMATETILMRAVARGGDRQDLHERIRRHALEASRVMKEEGGEADLMERISGDPAFPLERDELEEILDARAFVGRAPEQVDQFLDQDVQPLLNERTEQARNRLEEPDVRV